MRLQYSGSSDGRSDKGAAGFLLVEGWGRYHSHQMGSGEDSHVNTVDVGILELSN